MSSRRAFLIGAEEYGDGFASLPAVRQDIQLISSSLKACGYDVEICPPEFLTNASLLDNAIRSFCSDGGSEDIRILYFTGHGLLLDNVDCIIPAGTPRRAALNSPNQRVSTDLSQTVADSNIGLVLFIIDACRNTEDVPVTKGSAEWGDVSRLRKPEEARFIRYFGCASKQTCQVLLTISGEQDSSLFTKVLAERLDNGNCFSLIQLMRRVEEFSLKVLSEHPYLNNQTPRLSYGELSTDKLRVLNSLIFGTNGNEGCFSVWPVFEPNKLHCLVVISETDPQFSPDWGLKELVGEALRGRTTGKRIWDAFVVACNHRRLVSGQERTLPDSFGPSAVSFGFFSVINAFKNHEWLDKAVRALVEADLVIFDVTGFEPGVMLLIGIRSACRRSLSICSHGGGWNEGYELKVPFNLQELNINSHTPDASLVGTKPVVDRFVCRVETGFNQLSRHPHYLDLPAYDALRELGSDYDASSIIDVKERVLVLCSYSKKHFKNWQYIRSEIEEVLWDRLCNPKIERIIDYGTSQLIWQSLFEQIRRTTGCVVDWSEYNASVFLELGVRLAVSEWGAVQIVDHRYLEGGAKSPKPKLSQIDYIHQILNPITYEMGIKDSVAFKEVAEALLQRNPHLDGDVEYNRIHRVLLDVIGKVKEANMPLAEALKRKADALHNTQQGKVAAPQILFSGSRLTKQDSEQAALELRIAAWLYLEYRVNAQTAQHDIALMDMYRDLGRSAIDALYDLGDDNSVQLALYIEDQINKLK